MSIKNVKPTKNSFYKQGYFDVSESTKYVGPQPVIFRSSWEKKFAHYCEKNTKIIIDDLLQDESKASTILDQLTKEDETHKDELNKALLNVNVQDELNAIANERKWVQKSTKMTNEVKEKKIKELDKKEHNLKQNEINRATELQQILQHLEKGIQDHQHLLNDIKQRTNIANDVFKIINPELEQRLLIDSKLDVNQDIQEELENTEPFIDISIDNTQLNKNKKNTYTRHDILKTKDIPAMRYNQYLELQTKKKTIFGPNSNKVNYNPINPVEKFELFLKRKKLIENQILKTK